MAEIPIMKPNFLRVPRYSASVIRRQFLEKVLSVIFNFLVHVGRSEPAYSTRFAAILFRTMLQYLTSDRFNRDNSVDEETTTFLKQKLEHVEALLHSIGHLGDKALDEKDQNIIHAFPSLFVMEVILDRDLDSMLELIFASEPGSRTPMAAKDRHQKLDGIFGEVLNTVGRRNLGSPHASKIFGALLVRAFICQALQKQNDMDESTLQFLMRRKYDYSGFCSTSIQVGKGTMSDSQFRVMENHSPIFLTTALLTPELGSIVLEIITGSDRRILELPVTYLDNLIDAYDASFE